MKKYLNIVRTAPVAIGAGLLTLSTLSHAAIDVSDATDLLATVPAAITAVFAGVIVIVGTMYGLKKVISFIGTR